MNNELDAKLCEEFPEIFAQRNMSMQETCMCWGFACGDGWYQIIHDLCSVIKNHIWNLNNSIDYTNKKEGKEEPHVNCQAVQVKEKFGTLRFYTNYDDEYIAGAIHMAEHVSERTCEVCGKAGELKDIHGWLSTTCDEHRRKD
jgi:hypothetical protein